VLKIVRVTKPVEERKQEIIDIAREMFLENGFEKTQVASISKRMNVASGLIFHYFKTKTDILYAVFEKIAEERLDFLRKILENENGTALDRINLLFARELNFGMYEKLAVSISTDPAINEYFRHKNSDAVTSLITALIEQGNDDGSLQCKYPKETAIFILYGMGGVMPLIAASNEPETDKLEKYNSFKEMIIRLLDAKATQ